MNKNILFNPKTTAIVIVDMQIGFREGFFIERWRRLVDAHRSFLEVVINHKIPILVMMYQRMGIFEPGISELLKKKKSLVHYVDKNYDSSFHSTVLEEKLRGLGIETIIITGINTCCCIQLTVKDAIDCGFNVIASLDLVACAGCRETHDAKWVGYVSLKKSIATERSDSIINIIESPQVLPLS
jgi:nicotinamidase-related amidase